MSYYIVRTNKRRWLVDRSSTGAATYAVQSHPDYGKDEYVKETKLAVDYPPYLRALSRGSAGKSLKLRRIE